ncbi:lamin tail domain-containing protein [Anaerobaca lacustris]|uniref:Lamin tail domain-containing protein n=1 Tax=Anaerobaca lacustris TaxID=3044600 RepID=A0AAW6TXP8_9BACT|nr:lamin tail domain-containing protein [Sedimentisphaerales bacterium M17dextr]
MKLACARFCTIACLLTIFVAASAWAQPHVCINEIMASNGTTLADEDGDFEDWIELYNPGPSAVDLRGFGLSDRSDDPLQWVFPEVIIEPGQFLLVWASGKDRRKATAPLHANFRISTEAEEVLLTAPEGARIDETMSHGVPRDISWGRDPDGSGNWCTLAPTPGASNDGWFLPVVSDIAFSHERGFYDEPIRVVLETETPGATIRYTLDGSTPTANHGAIYAGLIPIETTTCLRAIAFKAGWEPTNVHTHTYLFLDHVIRQATDPLTGAQVTPEGYPTSWGSVRGDYQMDPDVVGRNGTDIFGGLYANTIRDDLKAVPTISLVMNRDDWFGSKGIYINQSQDGTERVASMEYIDPAGAEGFQVNCALAMQGGISGGGTSLQRWKTFKLSMRPRFKPYTDDGTPTGGPSRLDFKLFGDSPVERHNTVVLDAVLNHSWLHPGGDQRNTAVYIQDQYVADLHDAMGGHSPHGAYAHMYINGLYWGLYYIHERPDHAWAAEMFGGGKDEYDAIKHGSGGVINSATGGSATANYNAMVAAANAVAADPDNAAKYDALCERLDVDDFIAYLLANWYTGNHDWPHKNWYATRRNAPGGKWRFHSWDAEHTLEGTNEVGKSPSDIHLKLSQNAEYRVRMADLVYRYFFHGRPLSYPASAEAFLFRMGQIERAIVGESARWGDNRQSRPYTQQDWLNTQTIKLTGMFPNRADQVLGWLKAVGLYPRIDAPEFRAQGLAQHGGPIPSGGIVSMTGDPGTVWYTLDGSDPRRPGSGGQAGEEFAWVTEDAPKKVLVPTASIGDGWRGLEFGDSAWISGAGGVGYERSTGYEHLFEIDVHDAMYGRNTSCYIRISFEVTPEGLTEAAGLRLKVRYDDGFVAYLNGVEVQRAMFNGVPSWNSGAAGSHSDAEAVHLETFDISSSIHHMRLGRNILAIHGLNAGATSSDFLISVELTSIMGSGGAVPSGVSPSASQYVRPLMLTESVQIAARAFDGQTWSALNEVTFGVGPVAQSLRISELMYHPVDPNAEYVELTNVGSQTINLNLVAFTDGIRYTFPGVELAPGAYMLVAEDLAAFEAAYGAGLPVVGPYSGKLSNAGERIELQDATGAVIQSFTYRDNWYRITDGQGFSLTVKDPAGSDSLDAKDAWRPSAQPGGSPGFDD